FVRPQPRNGRLRTMTNIKRDDAASRRRKLNPDSVGRRPSPTVNARRRLNAPRPGTVLAASQVGGGDPRCAYLDPRRCCRAETHDWEEPEAHRSMSSGDSDRLPVS